MIRSTLPRPSRRVAAAALVAALGLAVPASADQTDHIVFDVVLKGISAGRLTIDGKIAGDSYGANGKMQTTGIAAMLRTISYNGSVSGSYADDSFTPTQFDLTSQRGDDNSRNVMVYKAGVPVSVSREPPRKPKPNDVDPSKQGGTIDPLTALYAVLRDVTPDEACKLSVTMFDGTRRSQVSLSAPTPAGKGVSCTGEYRRLEGFSAKDMADKTRFPFTLVYKPTADGSRLQVVEINTDTILGKGRLVRR